MGGSIQPAPSSSYQSKETMPITITTTTKCLAGCEWSNKMELSILPTTADNLTVKIEKEKLIIEGKSESTTERNGFKTKSTHQWSREMKIPDHINHESIKVKLNEDKETLTIESENIEKKSTQIPITIQ